MVASPRQYDVCANRGAARERVPFLLVLQHDVARVLETRLAVPMIPANSRARVLDKIEPIVAVDGVPHVAVVSQLRALPLADFGEVVISAETERYAFTNAVDFLLSGY